MALRFIALFCLTALTSAYPYPEYAGPAFGNDYKNNRVIGGKACHKGEFPHQISLQWGFPPYIPFSHMCGGSIIGEHWILTAAHCVVDLPKYGYLVVKAGKHLIKEREDTEQLSLAGRIFVHQEYAGSVSPYDIAIVKLITPLKYNEYVKPISLPRPHIIPSGNATLSGWGSISKTMIPVSPNALQKVTLPLLDLNTCKRAMMLLGETGDVHHTHICTGPLTGGLSACNGDSGGPLIADTEIGTKEIIGIVSWGRIPCGSPGSPAVFVRVSAFIDWITYVMGDHY